MQVNIKQAIRLFFSNPSLDMVFIEAIANSLDADASKISICISIDELGKQETLKITVQDNGVMGHRTKRILRIERKEYQTY